MFGIVLAGLTWLGCMATLGAIVASIVEEINHG